LLAIVAAVVLATSLAGVAQARSILYGAAHLGKNGPSTLYTIDPSSGAATPVGTGIGFNRVSGMDFDTSGRLFATGERPDGSTVLLRIDPTTGVGTVIGTIPPHSFGTLEEGSAIADIAFRPSDGVLFAYLEPNDGVGIINPATAILTELGSTQTAFGNGNGIAFASDDRLFHIQFTQVIDADGKVNNVLNVNTLDQTTGAATFVIGVFLPPATIVAQPKFPRVDAMKFEPETGVLYASLNAGIASSPRNYLAIVSPITGTMAVMGPTVDGLDALAWLPTQCAPPDTTPPSITCPLPLTVQCIGPSGTPATFSPIASDESGPPTTSCTPPSGSTFALGTTAVSCTATDRAGNSRSCSTTVTVVDTTAPAITSVSARPKSLWPLNHKMVPVTVAVTATDICDPAAADRCKIISVSSNEPVNGPGDGNTSPDWQITGNLTVNLRAERSGPGDGRVYTLTIECTDASGNRSRTTATVTVAHDQGN
jgi:hypothetical protein